MLIRDALFTAIDFESAGEAPGQTDAPVQTGMAQMRGDVILTDTFFRSYIDPVRPVAWAAQQVHGITRVHLQGAPRMNSLWPEFRARLSGGAVVAHGAGTEKRFLRAFPLHGFGPWLDSLTISRRAWPGLNDYSLEALVRSLGLHGELEALCPDSRFHDALYDAAGSLLLLRELIRGAGLLERPVQALIGP